ncbi:MAG: hypothetical protein J0H67_03520 [Rhodospirillales bacterium]|nr:hypothetical protein [Rhodospirillales bacterium]
MRLSDEQLLAQFTQRMPRWQWHAMCMLAATMQVVFAVYARMLREQQPVPAARTRARAVPDSITRGPVRSSVGPALIP